MFTVHQNLFRSMTVGLIYCLVSFYIFSATPGSIVSAQTPASQMVTGILDISGAKFVLLNGNKTPKGTTVLSGAQLETENANGAMVTFDRLGRIEVGCRSSVKLNFTAERVEVTVLSGFARLVTNQGIMGTLITPDAMELKTDASLPTSTVETSTQNPCGPLVFAAVPAAGAAAGVATTGGLFGLGWVATAILAIAAPVTAAAIVVAAAGGSSCDPQAVSNVIPCSP